jgi:uncharacterized membrane protein
MEQSRALIEWMSRGIELAAAAIIGAAALQGAFRALLLFLRRPSQPSQILAVRLDLGRWLALGLEFELAADVLRTAVSPTWNDIGQLAAIAALRTLLNYFLAREIQQE